MTIKAVVFDFGGVLIDWNPRYVYRELLETEEEVEDIFNAMRVNKAETRIHWHEFIAAGLSQCQVDDRNLRLAFDRLDSDHKGVSKSYHE